MENDPKIEEMIYNSSIKFLESSIKSYEGLLKQYEKTKKEIEDGKALRGRIDNFNYSIEEAKTTTIPIENNEDNKKITESTFEEIEKDVINFPNWTRLSETEKDIIKNIYEQLTKTNTITEQEKIINAIEKTHIISGIKQIIIEKIKKDTQANTNTSKREKIEKIIKTQEEKIIKQWVSVEAIKAIKETYTIVEQYTIQPNTFSIIKNESNPFNENGNTAQPILERITQVNFILKNNTEEWGTIGFDIYGKLISKEIENKGKTYTLTQKGKNIQITEQEEKLSEYSEFIDMEKNLNTLLSWVKNTLVTFSALNNYDYKKFTFSEESKKNASTRKIYYDGTLLTENWNRNQR